MKTKKEKKVKTKKPFMNGVKEELKKVKWPSAKEIVKYTIATIVLVVVIALFFQLLNVLISFVKGLI